MKKPEPATLNHGAQFRTVFKTLRDLEGERLLFLCDTFFFFSPSELTVYPLPCKT